MKIQKKTLETDNLIVSCDEEFLTIELMDKPEKGKSKKIIISEKLTKELVELIKQTSPSYKMLKLAENTVKNQTEIQSKIENPDNNLVDFDNITSVSDTNKQTLKSIPYMEMKP